LIVAGGAAEALGDLGDRQPVGLAVVACELGGAAALVDAV